MECRQGGSHAASEAEGGARYQASPGMQKSNGISQGLTLWSWPSVPTKLVCAPDQPCHASQVQPPSRSVETTMLMHVTTAP